MIKVSSLTDTPCALSFNHFGSIESIDKTLDPYKTRKSNVKRSMEQFAKNSQKYQHRRSSWDIKNYEILHNKFEIFLLLHGVQVQYSSIQRNRVVFEPNTLNEILSPSWDCNTCKFKRHIDDLSWRRIISKIFPQHVCSDRGRYNKNANE